MKRTLDLITAGFIVVNILTNAWDHDFSAMLGWVVALIFLVEVLINDSNETKHT